MEEIRQTDPTEAVGCTMATGQEAQKEILDYATTQGNDECREIGSAAIEEAADRSDGGLSSEPSAHNCACGR